MAALPSECTARGPHAVGLLTLELRDAEKPGRALPVDLWFPANRDALGSDSEESAEHPFGQPHAAIPGAAPAPGRFPLLAFSHGNSGLRRQSTFLTTHLASWGFVVAAPDHTGNTFPEMLGLDEEARKQVHLEVRGQRPRDLAAAIEAAFAGRRELPAVDPDRIGVLGHSFGGWTALKMPRLDARVRAVCGLAPASEPFVGRRAFEPDELPFARPIPTLLVAGVEDVLVDLETSVLPLFARLEKPRGLIGVERADHYHFCDGIELLHGMHYANPREKQPRPTKPWGEVLPEERMHRILRGVVAAFFRTALLGEGDPLEPLSSDELGWLDAALRRLD